MHGLLQELLWSHKRQNDGIYPKWVHDSHFVVKNRGLSWRGWGDQVLVNDTKNVIANLAEFLLNLLAVTLNKSNIVVISLRLLLLLNWRHNAPRSSPSTNDIFVSHREEVPLLHSQLKIKSCNLFHTLDHFWVINQI